MSREQREGYLKIFKEAGALLEGHFLLSSGRHSAAYIQCARVLSHPAKAQLLGEALAGKCRHLSLEAVISPAIGGIVIGHEVARALGVRSIFTERSGGRMILRRGFEIRKGERFLAVEDVLTTGGSLMEMMEVVKEMGGETAAAAAIVFRGAEMPSLGVPFSFLLALQIPSYDAEECPLCRDGAGPPIKPGSRGTL